MELRILDLSDLDHVYEFEIDRLNARGLEGVHLDLEVWQARWRKESLLHYLGLGWSFGIWKSKTLMGYLLAQPFVFFDGQTQVLWVEWMSFHSADVGRLLIDTAIRYGKEKHLQKVLFGAEVTSPEIWEGFAVRVRGGPSLREI